MLSWDKIEPPKLLFAKNQTHSVPIEGLKKYGPYDEGVTINLYIIAPKKQQRYTKYLVQGIERKLNKLLDTKIEVVGELYLEKDYSKNNYENAVIEKVLEWREDKRKAKLLLQVIPRKDPWPDGYYWTLRKIALSEYSGLLALPIQTITEDRLREYYRNYKRANGIAENLAIAFYAKVGRRPWILADKISSCYSSAVYVGFDISYQRKTGQEGMGGIVVFDSKGQVIDFFDLDIQVEAEEDRIKEGSFREFVKRIILSAKAAEEKPDVIVFHRDGDYYYNEVKIIRDYMNREGYDYVVLSFPKRRSAFPLFKKISSSNYTTIQLAESGYYAELGQQLAKDGKWYRTFGLQSLGYEIPLGVPPDILKFRLVHYKTKNNMCGSFIRDMARQVFWLTRLNYATKFGFAKLPITVHYAHKLANIKRNAIKLAPFDGDSPNRPLLMI